LCNKVNDNQIAHLVIRFCSLF